jgi:DNA (cytosine-5)-methyltransferase 1
MATFSQCAVSLFSGGGIGDCGVQFGAGVPVIACCEIDPSRARLISQMLPDAQVHCGDIRVLTQDIINGVRQRIPNRPWLLVMSPPCQGMSLIRGAHSKNDPRNTLILPALEVAGALQPEWIVVENVPNMQRTTITNELGQSENIIDAIRRRLPGYAVRPKVLDAQHFGVPQHRERMFVICRRADNPTVDFHPPATHGAGLRPVVTLERATGHLAVLDALTYPSDPTDTAHCVPRWTARVHFWMAHTPAGKSAFANTTCVECGVENEDSAVRCADCQAWLARPRIEEFMSCTTCDRKITGSRCECGRRGKRVASRLIKGYRTKIYRRMRCDEPTPTITTHSGDASCDIKVHPAQHRVLSLREVLIVSSVAPYPGCPLPWAEATRALELRAPTTIRTIVGESIPPLMTSTIVRFLQTL